ncbi:MAG: hypothetical protein MUF05_03670 [Candidatus Omnitrophica bacterium]|jgi:hypothetical protein|nr:hypothetical protein [Candidatus Omnitrophota bacterium]
MWNAKNSKIGVWAWAFFIFAFSFIPRFLLLSKGPFHYDTAEFILVMQDKLAYPHAASFPFVSFFIISLGFIRDALFPWAAYQDVLFFSTSFISALTAVVIYLCFRKTIADSSALSWALLTSCFAPFFSVTTYGRIDHALGQLFLVFSLFYFLSNTFWLCAFFTGLAIASRNENMIIFAGFFAYYVNIVFKKRHEGFLKQILIFGARFLGIIFFSFAIVILLALLVPNCRAYLNVFSSAIGINVQSDSMEVFSGFSLARFRQGWQALWHWAYMAVIWAVLGVFLGFLKEKKEEAVLFFVAFAVSFMLLVNMQTFSPRYLIPASFFMFYFSSQAICFVFKKNIICATAMLFVCLTMLMPAKNILYSRHVNNYQKDFALFVESATEPDSIIIIQDEHIFLKLYTKRKYLLPPVNCDQAQWDDFFGKIIVLNRAGYPVYLTSTALGYDPCFILKSILQEHFYVKPMGMRRNESWYGKEVAQYFYNEHLFRILPSS